MTCSHVNRRPTGQTILCGRCRGRVRWRVWQCLDCRTKFVPARPRRTA